MELSNILKIIWFIILLALFFASDFSNKVFTWIKENISLYNINFFEKVPSEILFFFIFLIFIIILAFIMSFYGKD